MYHLLFCDISNVLLFIHWKNYLYWLFCIHYSHENDLNDVITESFPSNDASVKNCFHLHPRICHFLLAFVLRSEAACLAIMHLPMSCGDQERRIVQSEARRKAALKTTLEKANSGSVACDSSVKFSSIFDHNEKVCASKPQHARTTISKPVPGAFSKPDSRSVALLKIKE